MKIIKNDNFRPGRNCGQRTEAIRYIVIHYTGSEGTAKDNINYFNAGNRGASAHYFVGQNGEVREYCDPAKWYAWHCGGPVESSHHPLRNICTNRNSAGVEICCSQKGGVWTFTKEAVDAAVELTRTLMDRFGVPVDRVCRHYDVTGKSCPRVPGWGAVGGSAEWQKFKQRIEGKSVPETPATDPPRYYRVRKTWADAKSQVGAYTGYDAAKVEADKRGADYAVFDWAGKEVYRPAAAEKNEKSAEKKRTEIRFFYPGYTRRDDPDDRQGAGCIWHDQDGHVLIFDAYMKNSEPAAKMIKYLKDNGLTDVDTAVLSHAHTDHGGGFFKMLESGIKIKNFLCYDPASLRLAGTGSGNARGVKEDQEYLRGLISYMRRLGAAVRYIGDGDTVTCGDMLFEVYREQPDHFTANDGGYGWAYTNDGSLCLYEPDLGVLLVGDADGSHAADHCGTINVVEAGHHGNNGTESKAKKFKSKGCRLAIECNNETNGPGSCSFTRWCARRLIEAGVEVWMLNANIYGRAAMNKDGKTGKLYVKQGQRSRSFDITFGERPAAGKADGKTGGEEFRVHVRTDMNIRTGPGTKYEACGTARPGIYTITVTDGDWGRLKSGAGWIYLGNGAWVQRVQ